MNPIVFVMRRPIATLMLIAGLTSGGVFALQHKGVALPKVNTSKVRGFLESLGKRTEHKEEQPQQERPKIVVTSPRVQDVVLTEPFVCQIHARRHVEIRALKEGYLQEIAVGEGQAVKKDELMFKVFPPLYQARLEAEQAAAELARLEFQFSKELLDSRVVSPNKVKLLQAKLSNAQANAKLAGAELGFTNVRAPFDGIVDRLHEQLGSLVDKGDILTTLSDTSVMWVYFNVREARYLEYMASQRRRLDLRLMPWGDGYGVPTSGRNLVIVGTDDKHLLHIRIFDEAGKRDADAVETQLPDQAAAIATLKQRLPRLSPPHVLSTLEKAQVLGSARSIVGLMDDERIELVMANGEKFPQVGKIGAIEAKFNNMTGNIPFRADFANPDGLLRHGQTGTILIHQPLKNALIIPQRAIFELLDKQYVWVVDEQDVVHRRLLTVNKSLLEDIFIIDKGLKPGDKIVLEGVREVQDGQKVEYEFRKPDEALDKANQKFRAE